MYVICQLYVLIFIMHVNNIYHEYVKWIFKKVVIHIHTNTYIHKTYTCMIYFRFTTTFVHPMPLR